jgi:hypothetical protein
MWFEYRNAEGQTVSRGPQLVWRKIYLTPDEVALLTEEEKKKYGIE